MDKKQVRKIVEEYAKVVVANMMVNKIILYGSYARGDYRKNSDIDVAVVISKKDVQKNILKQMGQLVRLTRNISFDIEPILLIEDDDRSGFLESISKYGEVVYSK